MSSWRELALTLCALVLLVTCSVSGGSGRTADAGESDTGATAASYPTGPYGNTMGAILTNLQLSGYLNDSGTGLANEAGKNNWRDAYSLQDVRATGAKYALVHVSEFL